MKNEIIKLTAKHIESLKPMALTDDPGVFSQAVKNYRHINRDRKGNMVSQGIAEALVHKEAFNFKKLITEDTKLRECENLSLYGVFLDSIALGVSLERVSKPDCYVIPQPVNIGTKQSPKWTTRAKLEISPYGELKIRQMRGQIKHADDPIIVYEGDQIKVEAGPDGKKVYHTKAIPRKTDKIIMCYMRITRPDGSIDFGIMEPEDIERLKGYSDRKNKGKGANALYSSNKGQIDPGFLKAKTIKHAFSTYSRVRVGDFTEMQSDESLEAKVMANEVDYGFDQPEDVEHEEVPKPEKTDKKTKQVDPVNDENEEDYFD